MIFGRQQLRRHSTTSTGRFAANAQLVYVYWGGRIVVENARKALVCTCFTGKIEILLQLTPLRRVLKKVIKDGLIKMDGGEARRGNHTD